MELTMKKSTVCQSCGMPFGGEVERGTESDGSLSLDYCIDCYKNCYKNGKFTEPDITFEEMVTKVSDQIKLEGFPEKMIAINRKKMLTFKRWH